MPNRGQKLSPFGGKNRVDSQSAVSAAHDPNELRSCLRIPWAEHVSRIPACDVPDLRLEFSEGFLRDAPLAPAIRDAEPQELTLLRSRHCALRLVDLQPHIILYRSPHNAFPLEKTG